MFVYLIIILLLQQLCISQLISSSFVFSKCSSFFFFAAGCHRPKPLKFASVPASAFGNASTFPIGTVFQYVCNPGYINIPGVNLTNVTCRKDNEWTEIAEFCEGKGTYTQAPLKLIETWQEYICSFPWGLRSEPCKVLLVCLECKVKTRSPNTDTARYV